MTLKTFTIIPILGRKTDVPQDDFSLFRFVAENIAITHDVGGLNVDYVRNRNTATKSQGYTAWSNSAVASPNRCHALFELDDGVNRDNILFESGRVFYYDGTPDPQQLQNAYIDYSSLAVGGGDGTVSAGDTVTGDTTATQATVVTGTTTASGTLYIKDITGGTGDFSASESLTFSGGETANCDSVVTRTTFNNSDGAYYSVIKFGSYMIFADSHSGHSPQKWKNGDNNLTNLVTTTDGTLFKFKYLKEWQRRVIGAYSNQTNGDLEIRWTGALPTWTDLEFAAANQLYKPGTDPITGISPLGVNHLLLYGSDSISQIVYYASASSPFGIIPQVQGQGAVSQHSIINTQGANWFFNKNYGFVRYVGGSRIISEDIISHDIETDIAGIDSRYYDRIIGRFIPHTNQLCWTVPLSGTTPSHFLYYDIGTKEWSIEDKVAKYIDTWTRAAGEYRKMVFANTDGHTYQVTGELLATGTLDGYRIEPIMDFGESQRFKSIQEIWFSIVEGGNYDLHLWHRSGNTVKEVTAASWTQIGTLNLNSPSEPSIKQFLKNARLHQIKWGTNADSEKFAINKIIFKYDIGGVY